MATAQVEYVGFTTIDTSRVYTLSVRTGGDCRSFTLAIPSAAFIAGRVRYQDAPEICFLKLRRELDAGAQQGAASHFDVSDAELEEYRLAHAAKAPVRRAKPAAPARDEAEPPPQSTPPTTTQG
jgi:hypothetical protein